MFGQVDLMVFFIININIWDVAAGVLLVKEAGGVVNDLKNLTKIILI